MTTSKMLTKDSTGVQMLSVNPCVNLWVNVIDLAVRDLKNENVLIREDAERYIFSDTSAFPWVCDHIGINAEFIRKELMQNM